MRRYFTSSHRSIRVAYPGKGAVIRTRAPGRRWRFGNAQLRVLLLAILVAALAWPQVVRHASQPVAEASDAR